MRGSTFDFAARRRSDLCPFLLLTGPINTLDHALAIRFAIGIGCSTPVKVNSHPTFSIPRNFTSLASDHLHPAERLFHSFSLLLAHLIPRMSRGPLTTALLRFVSFCATCGVMFIHEVLVPIPVCHNSCLQPKSRAPTWNRLGHQHRSISFRSAIGFAQKCLHQKPVAFPSYMSQVAELRLAAFGLPEQPGIGSVVDPWVWFFRFSP